MRRVPIRALKTHYKRNYQTSRPLRVVGSGSGETNQAQEHPFPHITSSYIWVTCLCHVPPEVRQQLLQPFVFELGAMVEEDVFSAVERTASRGRGAGRMSYALPKMMPFTIKSPDLLPSITIHSATAPSPLLRPRQLQYQQRQIAFQSTGRLNHSPTISSDGLVTSSAIGQPPFQALQGTQREASLTHDESSSFQHHKPSNFKKSEASRIFYKVLHIGFFTINTVVYITNTRSTR
ncbi:hypothetical protein ACRALDRAFT_205835 [Sodiomyces alcalophilus JCM 7366]|uniref:uncharacterized protein n=1 Tax=Sodiomyces alcalophilus JCM 7366 TaxID=591952 RepID=UPI0039B475FB